MNYIEIDFLERLFCPRHGAPRNLLVGLAQTAGLAGDCRGTLKLCASYRRRKMLECLRFCMSESSVPYIGCGNRIWTWLNRAGDECCWFVIFEDLLVVFPFDFFEYFVVEP